MKAKSFRITDDLAEELKKIKNSSAFIRKAIRNELKSRSALGKTK